MDDGLLPIGAFSRASLLSVKKLRAYHDAGILVPAQVDPWTGYRSYHWSQLADAAVIQRLRAVDLPLDQVREVVQAGDPAVTQRVLERHRVTMQARLDDVARAVEDLHEAVRAPALHTPVHVRRTGALDVLTVSGKVSEADLAGFLDGAYARLEATAQASGLAPGGPPGALYPPEIPDDVEEVSAFLPVALPEHHRQLPAGLGTPGPDGVLPGDGEVTASRVPAAEVAVAVHSGGYDAIGDTYRLLGGWVARNATSAGLPVREIYLVSYGDSEDPADFRTEIHWPVTPAVGM